MSNRTCKEKEAMKLYRSWYAEIYEKDENQTDDVNLLLALLGNQPKKVLEIACGGGRILVPIAGAGHEAMGFDMDEDRLAFIPSKAKGLSNLQFSRMDAIHEAWGSEYDVVVLGGNLLLNILADMPYAHAQQLFIQKAAASLKLGGTLFLDFGLFANPEEIFSKHNGRVIFEGTGSSGTYGKHVLIGDGYDKETQMAYGRRCTELTMPDGQQHTIHEKWEKHIPTLEQVHKWLRESGFSVLSEYGDYGKNPINERTTRAIIWAEKAY